MENNIENQFCDAETQDSTTGCKICSSPNIEEGYNVDLCESCRNMLSKRPFPVWVKLFSVIVLGLLVFSLIRLPSAVSGGVAFDRGEKAADQRNYITAALEYKKAADRYSDSTLVLAKLFIAQYYNMDFEEAINTFEIIAGREESNTTLVNNVNEIVDKIEKYYYPSKDLSSLMEANQNDNASLEKNLDEYLKEHPDDVVAALVLGNMKFDLEKYDEVESIMQKVISSNSDFWDGKLLLAATYREKGNYQKAEELCKDVLSVNTQNKLALGALVRLELKLGDVAKGLETATKSYELDKNDAFSISNMALAYHYNNKLDKRDEMFNEFKASKNVDEYTLNFLSSVFSGELKWR
ncbi:tetratricopeptide repeat protein [Acetivibrio cellulolyticus]|uniref:tetratricopeptide repeat protein n=1 Tax=Acetivibrio cellulolyticus TaxID=35830 RepID=UPI0001E2C732|nr:tetratricopeptide repeat protein [Acetivibrio cellulolyticus]